MTIEIDDDKARVDVDAVHAFLTTSYWAEGRTREEVEQHLRDAERVVGAYEGARQVGYARVGTEDGRVWLYDVYVLPEYRGRGLGVALVRAAVEEGPHADREWRLRTADAHGLYERFGFVRVDDRVMERPARL